MLKIYMKYIFNKNIYINKQNVYCEIKCTFAYIH